MNIRQKFFQVEYLVKKAIEAENAATKQELLLKMGTVLGLKIPEVEEFKQNIKRQTN